jgi:hypothetical protein
MIKNKTVVVPKTNPSKFAEPFDRAKIPKANAIGPIPLPKLDRNLAKSNRFTYL